MTFFFGSSHLIPSCLKTLQAKCFASLFTVPLPLSSRIFLRTFQQLHVVLFSLIPFIYPFLRDNARLRHVPCSISLSPVSKYNLLWICYTRQIFVLFTSLVQVKPSSTTEQNISCCCWFFLLLKPFHVYLSCFAQLNQSKFFFVFW